MDIEADDVHVLLQGSDGERARWWRERSGAGPPRTVMELRMPSHHGAVWVARHWVCDRAEDRGVPVELLPDIALLTSELVGNALVHGTGGEVEVRFSLGDLQVTIEVSDSSPGRPEVRDTGPATPGGHGLRLVEMLAATWGYHVHPGGNGKTVWFSIAT